MDPFQEGSRLMTTIEIDGTEPRAHRLLETVSSSGHFTAMQVRGGKARGVALHMQRLEAANRELFGADLDPDRVRALIRHALRDVKDASVRVFLYEGSGQPVTMVTVKQPAEIATPQGLMSVRYQRPDAHIKHVATDQGHYRRLAHRMGFDDALLTGDAGVVSETSMTNIGFFVDEGVVWPDAPMLHGITMRLLEVALPAAGTASRRAPVHLSDVASFDGAFLTNARGLAAVDRVDAQRIPVPAAMTALTDVFASLPWEPI